VIGAEQIAYKKTKIFFEFSNNITVIVSKRDKNVYEFCQDNKNSLIEKVV